MDRIAQKTEKPLSLSTRKRCATKARLRWKRVRKSFKKLRDPDAFARCQRALAALQKQADQGCLDLDDFDEAGFARAPTIPSAWQEPHRVIELPAVRTGRINVGGVRNRKNDVHADMFEQSIHTGGVVACFEAWCHTRTKKTVIVVDNASIHTSDDFADRLPSWKKQGLIVKYLRPSSPALHLIDILGRHIKYPWVPFSAYECLNALIAALEAILSPVGSKYHITFA